MIAMDDKIKALHIEINDLRLIEKSIENYNNMQMRELGFQIGEKSSWDQVIT